jgi:hypothetical protein
MPLVTILARDNDKPGNQELISFLEPNWEALLRSGLTFDLKIVEDKDVPDLIKKGIDKMPVAIMNDKQYASSIDIKMFLMKYLQKPGTAQRRRTRDPEEEYREFYKSEMSFEAAEREQEMENDDGKKDLISKYQDEIERRNKEDSKQGPTKLKGKKSATPVQKRIDNVSEDYEMEPEQPQRGSMVPKRENKIQGGDMSNPDDRRLMDMFETSDD